MKIQVPNNPIIIYCKEDSWMAKLATINLKYKRVAMVWRNTILLYGVSKNDFVKNPEWVLHEARHILQVRSLGFWKFYIDYIWDSYKNGYHCNKYEEDARSFECELHFLDKIVIL